MSPGATHASIYLYRHLACTGQVVGNAAWCEVSGVAAFWRADYQTPGGTPSLGGMELSTLPRDPIARTKQLSALHGNRISRAKTASISQKQKIVNQFCELSIMESFSEWVVGRPIPIKLSIFDISYRFRYLIIGFSIIIINLGRSNASDFFW